MTTDAIFEGQCFAVLAMFWFQGAEVNREDLSYCPFRLKDKGIFNYDILNIVLSPLIYISLHGYDQCHFDSWKEHD